MALDSDSSCFVEHVFMKKLFVSQVVTFRLYQQRFFIIIIIAKQNPHRLDACISNINRVIATCWSLKLWRQFSNSLSLLSVLFPNLCSTCKKKKREPSFKGRKLNGNTVALLSGNLADSYLFFASA